MKQSSVPVIIAAAFLCGCATYQSAWHSNGELQVRVHAPEGMVGQPVTYCIDGKLVITTTNLTEVMSLLPKKNRIKVEMAGTKPVVKTINIAGNGSKQVLDVTLARN